MRNFRKMIATFSMVAILSSLVVSTAFAGTFTDVPADSTYSAAVEELAAAGVLDTSKTTFKGTEELSRAEAAKLAVLAAGFDLEPAGTSFTDVPKTAWYNVYVETALKHEVLGGYGNGKFGPMDKLTRAQYSKILVNALDLPSYDPAEPTFSDVTGWAVPFVETAYHWTVVGGFADGTFKPGNHVTRFQAAVMTNNSMPGNTVERGGTPDTPDTPDTPADEELEGGAGNLDDADFIAGLNNEDVTEGEEVKVAGLTLTADEGSDLGIMAVRLAFTHTGAAGHDDLEDYASEVAVYVEGEEVARLDGADFNDDNTYTKTVTLDGFNKIVANEEGELVVAIVGADNVDSVDLLDANNGWDVEFVSVRYADASGAIVTDDATGDIGGVTRDFEFVGEEDGESIELKTSSADLDATTFLVDADAVSDMYEVFEFSLKGEENDIEVEELVLLMNIGTGAEDYDEVVNDVVLVIDGEEFSDVTVTDADDDEATLTFDIDRDYTLAADTTVQVVVKMEFQEQDGNYVSGETFEVSTVSVDGEGIDAVTDASVISSEIHTLSLAVPVVTGVTTTSTKSEDNTVGYISFEFDVTAESDDVVFTVTDNAAVDGAADEVTFTVTGTTPGIAVTALTLLDGDAVYAGTDWTIAEGDTATFAMDTTLTTTGADAGTYRVKLETIAGTTVDKISGPINLVD